MSCERYFVELPPQIILTPEELLDESLALVYPKDILMHRTVFFVPFEPMMLIKLEKKRLWSRTQRKRFQYNPVNVLRNNIKFMVKKTVNFGLLITQLTWVGLVNLAENRRVLQHSDSDLRSAALYLIMLKKETKTSQLIEFLDCLHITGNHAIANIIEAKLELLEENFENSEQYGHYTSLYDDYCDDSCEEQHLHYVPPKKRKTSADSGFDDEDDDPEMESSFAAAAAAAAISTMNGYAKRKYKCNIRPLDAVDVIAIINGKEDSNSKVELCKCGNYHQYPKWKQVNLRYPSISSENPFTRYNEMHRVNTNNTQSSSSLMSSSSTAVSGGFAKYFSRRSSTSSSFNSSNCVGTLDSKKEPRKGILSPVSHSQPVEVGLDLSDGMPDNLEFTKPRRSCAHLRLRFSTQNSFAEHPDNIVAATDSSQDESQNADNDGSLKSKLPRFLQRFL